LKTRRWLVRAALCALLVGGTGCSGFGFGRDWARSRLSSAETGVEGRWEGTWESHANGHRGRLRCLVTAPAGEEGAHQFQYRATWMRILSGTFKAGHRVRKVSPNSWAFEGEHRMPNWAGGLYRYEGVIRGDEFKATYRSSKDHGVFQMRRVVDKQ
jgi:hypothetical protein